MLKEIKMLDDEGGEVLPSAERQAVFNAPIYGSVQVGGSQNTQNTSLCQTPTELNPAFDTIFLETEQKQLLVALANAHRAVPRPERQAFVFHKARIHDGAISRATMHGIIDRGQSILYEGRVLTQKEDIPKELDQDFITHPGLDNGNIDTYLDDIEALNLQNLINFRDETRFTVSPQGFAYIDHILSALPKPHPEKPSVAPMPAPQSTTQ